MNFKKDHLYRLRYDNKVHIVRFVETIIGSEIWSDEKDVIFFWFRYKFGGFYFSERYIMDKDIEIEEVPEWEIPLVLMDHSEEKYTIFRMRS
jgi:hypothetical protein